MREGKKKKKRRDRPDTWYAENQGKERGEMIGIGGF